MAPKRPKRTEQLGRVRVDDYAWMKDDAWQKVMRDPKVLRADIRQHLEAENAYTAAMLKSTEPLQAQLFQEMKARIKEDDSSVPARDGAWEYYTRYEKGAQHPIYARRLNVVGTMPGALPEKSRLRTPEQILVDAEALAKGHAYYKVAAASHSPDHTLYAYAEDDQGSEVYTIRVKDLATGQLLPDPVESSTGDFAISPDSRHLFWTFRDDNGRPTKIFRRPIRGGKKDDVLVYHETDPGMFIGVGRSADDRFMIIGIGDQETSEARIIPASDLTGEPRVLEPRARGVKYDADHWGDRWVILTNADGAVDFKLVTAPSDQPGKANWKEWIAHEPGTFITGFAPYKDHLVRLERVNANNRLVVTERASMSDHEVAFPEEAYALSLEGGYEYDTLLTRFVYQSPTTPRQWFDYDMARRSRTLRKTQEIPSGHDPARYEARRLYATAPDGEQVPITVLMQRGKRLDGRSPLLLYGYGSYGIPMDAAFNTNRLSLVDRGWIFAIAHIRGGSEKGWNWFLQGRKEKKPNTFTDFIAAAEHLIKAGYTRPGKIVAQGGSAGGLLMGAVANLRPELWSGVIAQVPFVDVLNTMSDTSLPLTPPEWPEWGNPLEDPAAYDLILSYSPYDQVGPKPYPPILAEGGLSDPRVTYWEPAKWAAKLREQTTSGNPILLKINMEAGHGGASGRFDYLKEVARAYAFAIWADQRGWKKAQAA
ncbi:MAG: S9 family peptidase [Pseudomonadota bacterium]|nr:S9 family peptidase [Pseudomonadota bacterium]